MTFRIPAFLCTVKVGEFDHEQAEFKPWVKFLGALLYQYVGSLLLCWVTSRLCFNATGLRVPVLQLHSALLAVCALRAAFRVFHGKSII